MLKHTCKRLPNIQGHYQETSYTQAQLQETLNARGHYQETSNVQAQLQKTSNAQGQLQETYIDQVRM